MLMDMFKIDFKISYYISTTYKTEVFSKQMRHLRACRCQEFK